MKMLFDFLPVLLFFMAYKWGGIYVASIVAIIASAVQVLFLRFKTGQFQRTHLIAFFSILLFAGATLIFRNDLFIKLKPTIATWTIALGLLFSHFFTSKPFIQKMLHDNIDLPDKVWQHLNLSWVIFFTFIGALNLYIAYNFSTNVWVNFKFFGTLGLTVAFVGLQVLYLRK